MLGAMGPTTGPTRTLEEEEEEASFTTTEVMMTFTAARTIWTFQTTGTTAGSVDAGLNANSCCGGTMDASMIATRREDHLAIDGHLATTAVVETFMMSSTFGAHLLV
jgi:hypothetical protein